ncbi:MAG: hypothetical protein LC798_06840 [Chloroflexi bacterium]|nr:hypothetical protein [Chloroflexota bacterium]
MPDPDCFPWSEAVSLYTAKPHGAALSAKPLSPTPDRSGRSMRIRTGTLVSLTDDAQKKEWIDLVGPMVVQVPVRWDFSAVGSQIYTPNATSPVRGDHLMLVVGFNDDDSCWIVKNSWGPGWGDQGYARIAYAGNMLEPRAFMGVRGTNPDPWAKRRQRTGALVQGGNGARNNNFELFALVNGTIDHWYREHAVAQLPWNRVGPIRSVDQWRPLPEDAVDVPAVVQSSFNRNYELLYRCSENTLHHAYFDQASGWWFDARQIAGGGAALTDAVGIPGFIQSDRGAPGDFEAVAVTRSGSAQHWTKHNGAPWDRPSGQWYRRQTFGTGFAFSGPSLVQSRLGLAGFPENGRGELHYVAATATGRCSIGDEDPAGNGSFRVRLALA